MRTGEEISSMFTSTQKIRANKIMWKCLPQESASDRMPQEEGAKYVADTCNRAKRYDNRAAAGNY